MCTGNICRSPMAEAVLRHRFDQAGVSARVSSAGLLYDDVEASKGSVTAMARRGIDLTAHRSRVLKVEHLDSAGLILGMARMHAREAVVLDRGRFGRTFTLKEFVRRAEAVGKRGEESFDHWLGRVAAGRRTVDLLGENPIDDVEDPIGRSDRVYERTAVELSTLIDRMVSLAWALTAKNATASEAQG
ncbi:MAG: hypothetical protein WKF43_07265 [Acidimicrobiales bacterium]